MAALLIYNSFFSKPGYTPIDSKGNSLGNENATVVITEYSDFQCPACGKFYRETEKQFVENYVNTNKVKLIYKHFPLRQSHIYAQKAAEASECANEQGKFWEYHNKLFENQNALSVPSLKEYASQLGLDRTKFDACLDSGAMSQRVQDNYDDGLSRGVKATPTFFINNVKIEGAYSYSAFSKNIDAQLK